MNQWLQDALCISETSNNAVCLAGSVGIGKTAAANEFAAYVLKQRICQ